MIVLDFLIFKQIGFFTPLVQIFLIIFLFLFTLITQRRQFKETGFTWGKYPWRISTFLSSAYEEIIFRGIVLFGLMYALPIFWSVVISSVLFGLWHIKNYKWQSKKDTIYQVLYTGIIFGPIACVITLWTGTIWMAVILHYAHNLLISIFNKYLIRYEQ